MLHMSIAVAGCVLSAAALSMAVAPPPAVGLEGGPSRVVLRDAADDVWRVDVRTSEWMLVVDLPAADARVARIRHGSHAVTVRMRYADLRRTGLHRHWAGITTPDDDYFVEVTTRPKRPAGRHALYDGPAGDRLGCAALSHRVDYVADTVAVRIPRRCLGGPSWVKVNAGNVLVLGVAPRRRHYADNPHNQQPYSNTGTRRIHWVGLER